MGSEAAVPAGDRCIYCGSTEGITDDHVPPKGVFPDPKPSDLVTVPACQPCNAGFARDDEYFRNMLAAAVSGPLWKKAMRSFERRPRIRAAMIRSLARIEYRTPAGLHVGEAVGVRIERERADSVVKRIARGLLWHHYGRVPVAGSMLNVWTDQHLLKLPARDEATLRESFGEGRDGSIGGKVFGYMYSVAVDAPDASMWWMSFFEQVNFIVFIVPPGVELPHLPA